MNLPIANVPKSSYMSGLDDTGAGLNLENIEEHQSVTEHHPDLVLKFSYLKDLEDMDIFNISGLDGGKESEQGKVGVDVTALFTFKTPFMVNGKLMTVYIALREGVACNTIFLWPFLQTIKASIMTKKKALFSGLLIEQFRMEIIFPQRSKEAPKTPEGLPLSLPVSIQGKQANMKDRGRRNSRVELRKTVIQQHQIPGQH